MRRNTIEASNIAQRALAHMLSHLDAVDAQLAAIDHELEQVATSEPWPTRCAGCVRFAASGS